MGSQVLDNVGWNVLGDDTLCFCLKHRALSQRAWPTKFPGRWWEAGRSTVLRPHPVSTH